MTWKMYTYSARFDFGCEIQKKVCVRNSLMVVQLLACGEKDWTQKHCNEDADHEPRSQ